MSHLNYEQLRLKAERIKKRDEQQAHLVMHQQARKLMQQYGYVRNDDGSYSKPNAQEAK